MEIFENTVMGVLPAAFTERLKNIVPDKDLGRVLDTFHRSKTFSFRVNTLKVSIEEVIRFLDARQAVYTRFAAAPDAFTVRDADRESWSRDPWVQEGKIYIQNLSSILPAAVLDPRPGEKVLDMCAAPGGKTCQMAAMMKNEGEITAVDVVRARFYKLKNTLDRAGVRIAAPLCMDSRRYRAHSPFDRVLVDAPCSSEGRFSADNPKTYRYWSVRKIVEMTRKQRGLLGNAVRLLKPGGVLVYSTCAISPEENESNVDWLLKKYKERLRLEKVSLPGVRVQESLTSWNGRVFSAPVARAVRVLPDTDMEAFFIARFVLE